MGSTALIKTWYIKILTSNQMKTELCTENQNLNLKVVEYILLNVQNAKRSMKARQK